MDTYSKKCSSQEHKEINAKSYCKNCKIFLCNKCETFHSKLFPHQTFPLDKDIEDIFNEYCQEEKHNQELEFFCKSHNKLCCAFCLCKIKKKNFGQHKDCDVCDIEDIKEEKRNNLKNNIIYLEKISNSLQDTINKLKNIYDKINENKENLKLEIQKIFTKIRNELNNREDKLLSEIDNKFESLFIKEDIIKNIEKLPNKVNKSLEKCKLMDKEDKINSNIIHFINNCINIENNISDINLIYESAKKLENSMDTKIEFNQEGTDEIIEKIKYFGKLIITDKNIDDFKKSLIIKDDIDKQKAIINWIKEKTNKIKLNLNKFLK